MAHAATNHVNQDGTGDFTSIQEAVDVSVDGDIVITGVCNWETNGPFGGNINYVQYDCEVPGLCYAGGENGFFRSEDGGVTWRRSTPDLDWPSVECRDFFASGTVSGLLYASFRYQVL